MSGVEFREMSSGGREMTSGGEREKHRAWTHDNDMQIYLPVRKNIDTMLDSLRVCLREVKAWLSNYFLNLNESKTKLVWFERPAMSDLPNLGEFSPYHKLTV